jgi:hypothetical protein
MLLFYFALKQHPFADAEVAQIVADPAQVYPAGNLFRFRRYCNL